MLAALVDWRVKFEVDVVLLLSLNTLELFPDLFGTALEVPVVLLPTLASFVIPEFDLLFNALELDAETPEKPVDPPPLFIFVSVDLLCP